MKHIAAKLRSTPGLLLSCSFFAFFCIWFPFSLEFFVKHAGIATVGWILLGFTIVSSILSLRLGVIPGFSGIAAVALGATGVTAGLSGSIIPLYLVAPVSCGTLALLLGKTVFDECSFFEQLARVFEPLAPPFIKAYCRKITLAWAIVLGCDAVGVAILVFWGPESSWLDGVRVAVFLFGAGAVGEVLIRKVYFRHYPGNPPPILDRIFARFFPADRTEMGRRSIAYIAEFHKEFEESA